MSENNNIKEVGYQYHQCLICYTTYEQTNSPYENADYIQKVMECCAENLYAEIIGDDFDWNLGNQDLPFCSDCWEAARKIYECTTEKKTEYEIDETVRILSGNILANRKYLKIIGAGTSEKPTIPTGATGEGVKIEGITLDRNVKCKLCHNMHLTGDSAQTTPGLIELDMSQKIMDVCEQHLYPELIDETFYDDWASIPFNNVAPFCTQCSHALTRIMELDEKLKKIDNWKTNFVDIFTLKVLKCRKALRKKGRWRIFPRRQSRSVSSTFSTDNQDDEVKVIGMYKASAYMDSDSSYSDSEYSEDAETTENVSPEGSLMNPGYSFPIENVSLRQNSVDTCVAASLSRKSLVKSPLILPLRKTQMTKSNETLRVSTQESSVVSNSMYIGSDGGVQVVGIFPASDYSPNFRVVPFEDSLLPTVENVYSVASTSDPRNSEEISGNVCLEGSLFNPAYSYPLEDDSTSRSESVATGVVASLPTKSLVRSPLILPPRGSQTTESKVSTQVSSATTEKQETVSVTPDQSTIKLAVAQNLIPKVTIAQNLIPKVTIAQNLATKVIMAQNLSPKVTMAQNLAPKVTMAQNLAPKVIMAKNLASKVTMALNLAPKVIMAKNLAPKVIMAKNLASKVTMAQNLAPKVTMAKNLASKVTIAHQPNSINRSEEYASLFKCRNCHKNFVNRKRWRAHEMECKTRNLISKSQYLRADCRKPRRSSRVTKICYKFRPLEVLQEFKCTYCPKAFGTKAGLARHNVSHDQMDKYRCGLCGESFENVERLKAHHRDDHANAQYPMPVKSLKTTTKKSSSKKNKSNRSAKRTYSCAFCSMPMINKIYLMEHIQTHYDVAHGQRCEICVRTFSTTGTLQTHSKSHHPQFYI